MCESQGTSYVFKMLLEFQCEYVKTCQSRTATEKRKEYPEEAHGSRLHK